MARIEARLKQLYEDRRITAAREASGMSRKQIVRRARLETELERLMTG